MNYNFLKSENLIKIKKYFRSFELICKHTSTAYIQLICSAQIALVASFN